MSVSTDGLLVFGVNYGEELPEAIEEIFTKYEIEGHYRYSSYDFNDVVDQELGIINKDMGYKEREEARKEYPVTLETYCHCEYPMYILSIPGTKYRCWRGDAIEVSPQDMILPQKKIDEFKKWMTDHNLPVKEPKWFLVSYWDG